jgi:hypothetical protein
VKHSRFPPLFFICVYLGQSVVSKGLGDLELRVKASI